MCQPLPTFLVLLIVRLRCSRHLSLRHDASTASVFCAPDGIINFLLQQFCLQAYFAADDSPVPPGTFDSVAAVLTVIESGLQVYPSYLGTMAISLLPNVPRDSLGTPLVRSALRADQSPLLSPVFSASDTLLPAVLNDAAGNLPLATLSVGLRTWNTASGTFETAVPPILDASGVGGAARNPFNVSMTRGAPGTYSFVVFVQASACAHVRASLCMCCLCSVGWEDKGGAGVVSLLAPRHAHLMYPSCFMTR
jgi:hypothetical protein